MVDVDYYLGLKYAALNKQAGAAETSAQAAGTSAQAHLLSAQSGAGLDAHRGAALDSESRLNPARAALLQSQARSNDALTGFDYGGAAPAMPPGYDENGNPVPGYSTGVDSVPGPGDPRVDSVKANLAPQEAVLNAGAADMVGRGLIDVLNAMGALKMGMPAAGPMPPPGGPEASEPPGYAKGTAKVQPKAESAPAPKAGTKDNGAGAAALMTFLRGMGGGGGAAPMAGPPVGMPGYARGTSDVKADMNQGYRGLDMLDYGGRFSAPVYDSVIPMSGAPVYRGMYQKRPSDFR